MRTSIIQPAFVLALALLVGKGLAFVATTQCTHAFLRPTQLLPGQLKNEQTHQQASPQRPLSFYLQQSSQAAEVAEVVVPDDAVILVKPAAMTRLMELKSKQPNPEESLVLRMGVRSGGCSGMSYAMDFASASDIEEDDAVDVYEPQGVKCVVDAKSMLYLYGMELDYSDELIGGGFKFFNPNAEESCGCGSSFGV
jgi:iron-sulfur cluster assembly accessory protein